MYYESGMFPLTAAETATNATSNDQGYVAEGGELPPPPEDPPKR